MEAIKTEQRRIQRFIDLSRPGNINRGSLYLQKQGGRIYGFERWQKKGQPLRKIYLGPLESEPVRELFSIRFQAQRLVRLEHDRNLLEKLRNQYENYDGTLIIVEHLGRMSEIRYALDFGERCHWYFQEGFILGKNLFVTSDDPHFGTDCRMITRVVDRIEEMFYGF